MRASLREALWCCMCRRMRVVRDADERVVACARGCAVGVVAKKCCIGYVSLV